MSLPTPTVPTSLGNIYLVNSAGTVQLPSYFNLENLSRQRTTEVQAIPGRDGPVKLRDAYLGPVTGEIRGRLVEASTTALETTLTGIFDKIREGDVKLFLGGTAATDRYLEIEIDNQSWRTPQLRTEGSLTIPFQALTPYWLENQTSTNASQSGQPKGQTVTNDGDVPVIPDSWVATAPGAAVTITNSTTSEVIDADLSTAGNYTISQQDFTIYNSNTPTVNALQLIDDNSFYYAPIRLLPGGNTITTVGGSSWSLAITWRERYYV